MQLINFEDISTQAMIWIAIFGLAWLIQMFYWLYFFSRLAGHKKLENPGRDQPVSLIICAKNEERNLLEHIPKIMEQDHSEFELIVVNDSSWDDTESVLKALSANYPQMRVIHLNEEKQNMHGKKFALTLGIKAARHDNILLTDADCIPCSTSWIRKMTNNLHNRKEIILGFSPYKKLPGVLNKIIRFDAWMIGIQYLSFAKAGLPYMGVGRNLAYDRKLFFRLGGFKNHYHLESGDDDLFVNQAATEKNTLVELSMDAQTLSVPKTTWKEWFRQKKRHFTTAPYYQPVHKSLLGLLSLSYLLMWCGFAAALIIHPALWILSGLILLRFIVQVIILHATSRKMGQADLVWLAPLLELKLAFLNAGLYISNLVLKPKKWN